ncbi:MAG: hypothetical protein LBQ83_01835 [Candidatus Margulisbacteria bacterium]|jgi:hypothetical protein|nr:hypothetical protein [Candidatus Margulisiibacteriota bacterium]
MANDYTGTYTGIQTGGQMKAADVTGALNKMEKVAYKVTELTASSTDTQYPSAKAVYDNLALKENASNKKTTISSTSDTEYPTAKAVATALATKQANLPVGTILMYDGSGWVNNQTLPGWYKCDGANGTPNLTNLFVRGAASSGGTGGANSQSITLTAANMPKHSHTLSGTLTTGNQSAGHTHSIEHNHAAFTSGNAGHHTHTVYMKIENSNAGAEFFSGWGIVNNTRDTSNVMGIHWSAPFSTSDPGDHAHSVDMPNFTGSSGGVSAGHTHNVTLSGSTGNAGSTADTPTAITVNTVPAYYALIYIKRIA